MSNENLPTHIAVVMDGNGRWAMARHRPRIAGHRAGVKRAAEIVKYCASKGINALSLFAFSSENWSRPATEINALMDIFNRALKKEINELNTQNICLRFIGNRVRFPLALQDTMAHAEATTQHNSGMKLYIAMNYGGRWDILQAASKLMTKAVEGSLKAEDLTESKFVAELALFPAHDPDLLIRTSGEQRISNFYLWQSAYTELYFSPVYWPDFSVAQLEKALEFYKSRERRFGAILVEESI